MVVKSIAENEDDILLGIMQLHNAGQAFDLDPTFSKGGFYRSMRVLTQRHARKFHSYWFVLQIR